MDRNEPHARRSFADVTLEEAVARARALVPALRNRAAETEALRGLPRATVEDLRATGLLRYQMPKRWGGMELPFFAIIDVAAEVARGCASSSWNLHNYANHSWMIAMYDPRAQEEVWGDDPDALVAGGVAFPQGRGRKVDGGYVIGGHWSFCSGVDPSPWSMFAATIRDADDGPPVDWRLCLVPRGEYEIVDDWQVLGMRGTGSKSVRAKDVFVPGHRALSMLDIRGGGCFPGARANPGPLFRVPLVALAGHFPAATVLGNAEAALELTLEAIAGRETSYTASRMRDFQAVQLKVGAAAARIAAARRLLRADCEQAWTDACAGRVPDTLAKLAYKRNAAFAGQLCTEAVDALHALAGANGIYDRYPIQRLFRDAHAAAGHISLSFDTQGSGWGAAALTGAAANPML
ncbi:MAG: acyl-CoA dehydrogenase family protein [Burkholderiales bacterium]|nr:acyl-CoA dehydrogenase family protein [Burkholderiales bacterium]